jgi:hypothetical protein
MASQCSNFWKYSQLNLFVAKDFAAFFMQPGFVFNKATMEDYADISASEVVTGSGYTKGTGITLSGIAVAQDNTGNRGVITWDSITFTPTGGNISICGAVIIDTTDDIIVGFEDALGTVVIADGQPYTITDPYVENV